ncbi:MAG: hypothetical protein WBV22_00650 [Anaerolineaceae bacterium]
MNDNPVISRAAEMVEGGQTQQAAYLLSKFLQENPLSPDSIPAWLLLTKVVDSRDKQIDCLQRVLQIDPGNGIALEMLKKIKGEQPFVFESTEVVKSESEIPAVTVPPLQEDVSTIPQGETAEQSDQHPSTPVSEEAPVATKPESSPEIERAISQIKSITEYFEDVRIETEKFQGTAGPDYQKMKGMIQELVSTGYILQVEEYTPPKVFGKPEVKITFARPIPIFKGFCHDYPFVYSRFTTQENKLGFYLDNIVGEQQAYIERSLGAREPGLDLLCIYTPDHNRLRTMAVIREKDEEHVTIDLYQGNRVRKIGEILRKPRQISETVNDADGRLMLRLVDHSAKDPKRAVYSIKKETSLLRYQSRAFDFFTRDILLRVGDPHRLSEDEEAIILMTGLLAVDYMI